MSKIHESFKLINEVNNQQLGQTLYDTLHPKSGARHIHIETPDEENVFMVTLKTIPKDHTGVAHILEHIALCGSKNFPVRDPFFMMLRRSLNTFMNASTANDHTSYYYASKNKQDFFNLMSVYNDAVFFPNLTEMDFLQEGHRLGLKNSSDLNGGLQFKGVVYNEMKGAMSDINSQMWQRMNFHLYPNTTYRFNSGGEPSDIPNLDYNALCDFHALHYHPENAIFMTVGNIKLHDLQEKIHDQVLHHFDTIDKKLNVPLQSSFKGMKTVFEKLPFKPQSDKDAHHIRAWLWPESTNLREWLLAKVVGSILIGDSASPLMRMLETTSLGSCPSSLTGVNNYFRQMSFCVGIEQSRPQDQNEFSDQVDQIIKKVIDEKIPQQRLEAVFNRFELSLRDRSSAYPYGLQLIHRCLGPALHGGEVESFLFMSDALSSIRKEVLNSNMIYDWMDQWLIRNPHQVLYCGQPDENTLKAQIQAEQSQLDSINQTLSESDREAIVHKDEQLDLHQKQPQDESVLPKIQLSEIPKDMKFLDAPNHPSLGLTIDHYTRPTNGLVFQKFIIDLPETHGETLQYLALLTDCLSEVGVAKTSYLERQEEYSYYTSGMGLDIDILTHLKNKTNHVVLSLTTKSLSNYSEDALKLLTSMWKQPRFDEKQRLKELVSQIRSSEMDAVAYNGHRFAMTAAWAMISPAGQISEQIDGLSFVKFIKELDKKLKKDENTHLTKIFQDIHKDIVNPAYRGLVVTDSDELSMQPTLAAHWNENKPLSTWVASFDPNYSSVAWIGDLQVNYCAKAFNVVMLDHVDAPALAALSHVLTNGYLHRVIREQGGAYGGGANYRPACGSFMFYSYRDPRNIETMESFESSIQWLIHDADIEALLEEAIITEMSRMESTESPLGAPNRVFSNALWGLSQEEKATYRKNILEVSAKDILMVAKKYLVNQPSSSVILTGEHQKSHLENCGYTIETL